jgi:hypothetical protein
LDNLNLNQSLEPVGPEPKGFTLLGHVFTEPVSFRLRRSRISAGIYAILIADRAWDTTDYEVIYVGQCDDFSRRVTMAHEHFADWATEAGGVDNLYVSFYPTPFLPEAQRRAVESSLIAHYNPPCNERAKHFSIGALLGIAR